MLRVLAVALLALAAAPAGCGRGAAPVVPDLVPTSEAPGTVAFEHDGELAAGAKLDAGNPLVVAYTLGRALGAGGALVVDVPTAVQEEADSLWLVPSTDSSSAARVTLDDATGALASIESAGRLGGGTGRVVVRLARDAAPGTTLRVRFQGQVPQIVLRSGFRVYEVDATGAVARVPEARSPAPPIVPGAAVTLGIFLPADARVGDEASMHVAALDAFGNVDTRFAGHLDLAGSPGVTVPPTLDLGPADAGLHVVEKVRFGAEGFALVTATTTLAGRPAAIRSNQTRVWAAAPAYRRYFGDTHFHTGSDVEPLTNPGGDHRGQFTTSDQAFAYLRDVSALDWGVSAEHDTGLTDVTWANNQRRVDALDVPGKFVTLLGYEWTPERRLGHHVVVFGDGPGAVNPLVGASSGKRKGPGAANVAELVAALRASKKRVIAIPHVMQPFPNADDAQKQHDEPHETWDGPKDSAAGAYVFNDVRRVGEIYSHHNDDFSEGGFVQRPEIAVDQPQLFELGVDRPWTFQHAWATGHRIGLVGGSDNHLDTPGMNNYAPTVQHHAGLAVVLAKDLTRESIFDALYDRRCYATSGARILLDFTVDGSVMGTELTRGAGDYISLSATSAGTAPISSVEIVVFDGGRFETLASAGDGSRSVESVTARKQLVTSTLAYVRVRQVDGEMAWSSPIWIDVKS